MKAHRLGSVYEKRVIEFIKFAEKIFPEIMVSFIILVLIAGI